MKQTLLNQLKMTRFAKQTAQRGVVLFFALIALVVMSLAAAALIRSVDTTTLIAGNLSFKRSTTVSADSGTESAITWLSLNTHTDSVLANSITTEKFYYPDNTGDAKSLVDGNTATVASGTDVDANGIDKAGNKITYIIQRMCKAAGPVTASNCVLSTYSNATNDYSTGNPQSIITLSKVPVYRITTKVVGPKNTVSYIQAFVG